MYIYEGQCANEACAVCECEDGEVPEDLKRSDDTECSCTEDAEESAKESAKDTKTRGQEVSAVDGDVSNVDRSSAGRF